MRSAVIAEGSADSRFDKFSNQTQSNPFFWLCHVIKYRATRGKRSKIALAGKSPQCHVNTPELLPVQIHPKSKSRIKI